MSIAYYFNFISPASFASHVLVQAHYGSLPFEYRPIFIPPFLMRNDSLMTPLTVSLARLEYDFEDLERRVRPLGVDPGPGIELYWKGRQGGAERRPEDAFDTFFACTGFEIAREQRCVREYVDRVFRAYWEEGRPITAPEELARVAAEVGIDPDAFASRVDSPALDELASQREHDFLHDGGFGVPLYVRDGVRFWGSDRLEWLLADAARRPAPPGLVRVRRPFALPPVARDASAADLICDFSFACPYSYLLLARLGQRPAGRALTLGLRAWAWPEGGYPARAGLHKASYVEEDAPRFARGLALPLSERAFELESSGRRAAAGFASALAQGAADVYLAAVFAALWGEGRDIDDAPVLEKVLVRAGLPRALAHAEPGSAPLLDPEANVFGVPLLRRGRRRYWGNDRLELLLEDAARDGEDPARREDARLPG